MENQLNNNNRQAGKYQQGSGSMYHRQHASNVPDYGGNSMDPIAESLMNQTENNQQL